MRQITIITMYFHEGQRNHQLLDVDTLVIGHVTLAGFFEMLYHVLTHQRALLLIMKLPTRSATGFRLCDIIWGDFNHTLLVVQCLGCRNEYSNTPNRSAVRGIGRMGLYPGNLREKSYPFSNWADICAVLTGHTAAIGDLNC